MTAVYIITGIIALIAVLSFVKINVAIDFYYNSENNGIYIKYLFFAKKIFPSAPKEKKPENEPEEGKEDKKREKKKNKKSLQEQINTIISIIHAVKKDVAKLLAYLFKKTISINEVGINALIGTGDPMYTGIAYGSACGIVYSTLEALKVKTRNISINADFDKAVFEGGIHTVIYTRLVHIYVLAARLAVIGIKILRRL